MGIESLLLPDQFVEAVAERGVGRLFLLCADGITQISRGRRDLSIRTASSSLSVSRLVCGNCAMSEASGSSSSALRHLLRLS